MSQPRRRLTRICAVLAVLAPLALLFGGRAAHAAPQLVAFTVVDGRLGIVHVTATGLPPNQLVVLGVLSSPLADTHYQPEYLNYTTSDGGTIDLNDNTGEFLCGSQIQLSVLAVGAMPTPLIPNPVLPIVSPDSALVQSPIILAQCPSTSPAIGIAGAANGIARVSGVGLAIKETVTVTVTSVLTGGTLGIALTQTDVQGNFSVPVPLFGPVCNDTIVPHAAGAAGSLAIGLPAAYICPPDPGVITGPALPTPSPTPSASSHPAGQNHAAPAPPQAAHLTVRNVPAVVRAHGLETIVVETGLPNALLRARFAGPAIQPSAFSVRADNQGRARITYQAARLPAGTATTVGYSISYTAGGHLLQRAGSFTVSG